MPAMILDGSKVSEINVDSIDVIVTDRCNLRCKYCFHKKTPLDMSDETLEKSIEFLKPQLSNNCEFNFFGGEPMLREEFTIGWMDKIRSMGESFRLHIATNCTIYSKDLVRIAKREPPHFLQVSYDGINQNENRGMNEIVTENLGRYIEEIGGNKLTVRLTFTHTSVSDLSRNIEHLYDIGIRRFAHHATYDNNWTESELIEYNKQLDSMHDFLKTHPDMINVYCECKNAVRNRKIFRCAMGRNLLAISPSGDIFPCHYAVGYDRFKIGNVYNNTLNRGRFVSINMVGCNECEARMSCHNCLMANYVFGGLMSKPLKCTCSMNKYEYSKVKDEYESRFKYSESEEKIISSSIMVLEDIYNNNKASLGEINEALADKSSCL